MPWVNGVFVSLGAPEYPAVTGESILADYFNAVINDLISGLNNIFAAVDIPQVAPGAGAYTLVLTDRGKHIYKTDATDVTVPPNASVAFPIGGAVCVVNDSDSDQDVVEGSGVTIYLDGTGASGTITLSPRSSLTLLKVATNTWYAQGRSATVA